MPISAEKAKAIDVSKALVRYGEAVKDSARLKFHQENLEKTRKQRERDYDKSNHQHSPYPSVAELQNKYRNRVEDDLKLIQEHIRKAEAKEHEAVSYFVKFFTGRVPTIPADSADPNKAFETKLASLESMIQEQKEASQKAIKVREERETQLEQFVRELQTQQVVQKLEYQSQIHSLQQLVEKQMLEMQEKFDKKLAQHGEKLALQNKQRTADLNGRVDDLGRDFEELAKKNKTQHDSLKKDVQAEIAGGLSKHAERIKTFEQQLQGLKAKPVKEAAPAAGISSLKNELSVLQTETRKQIDEHNNIIATLRTGLANSTAQAVTEDLMQRLEVVEHKLGQVDIDALEAATEMASFDFPDLQRRVANLQPDKFESRFKALEAAAATVKDTVGKILTDIVGVQKTLEDNDTRLDDAESNIEMIHHQVSQEIEATANTKAAMDSLKADLSTTLNGLSDTFGNIINELREANAALATRLATLEKRAASEQPPTPGAFGLKRTTTAGRLASPDTPNPSVRLESGLWKPVTDKLSKDMAALAEKVTKLDLLPGNISNQELKINQHAGQINALNKRFELAQEELLSLDDRFNNLTTKQLAEHMIGNLQQLCPNEAQLKADIDALTKLTKTLEDRVQECTGKVEKVDDNVTKMMLDFKENRASLNPEEGLNKKRRRIEVSPTKNGLGNSRSVSNGLQ